MDEQQAEILTQIWQLLVRGGADRRSPLHTPVVASIDADGRPDARVMVLRRAEPALSRLRFHTDARSPKCAALAGQAVSVLGYHPGEKVQLRISGRGEVLRSGDEVETAWAESSLFARRCYMAEQAPGTGLDQPGSGLPEAIEGQQPTEADIVPARPNFALVHVHVEQIDWLYLANSGHRRVQFEKSASGWVAAWVAP